MLACTRSIQAYEAPTCSSSSLQKLFEGPCGLNVTLESQHPATAAPPSLKSGYFKRRNRMCKTLTQLVSATPSASARLPDEILSQIARYTLGHVDDELEVAEPSSPKKKPPFGRIDGMTRASRRLRAIALPVWFRIFIVRQVDDWLWASRLRGMHAWVRHISCPPHALDVPASPNVLSNFPYLRSASLSMSCDYEFTLFQALDTPSLYDSASAQLDISPGFAYRQPVTEFPPTMTSLTVRSAHGSETPLLRNLGQQCPDLRTLRLGKCTMFDSCTTSKCSFDHAHDGYHGQIADGGQCPFWGAFPFSHDIYFGSEGTEAYAEELAAELAPLQKLEEISLGVYLTPHAALTKHRLEHYPWRHLDMAETVVPDAPLQNNAPNPDAPTIPPATLTPPALVFPFSTSQMAPPSFVNPELWSYDCLACRKSYSAPTVTAERTAGMILALVLPNLRKIEWASFFESRTDSEEFRRGTGTHEWRVVRDEAGSVIDLEQVVP